MRISSIKISIKIPPVVTKEMIKVLKTATTFIGILMLQTDKREKPLE